MKKSEGEVKAKGLDPVTTSLRLAVPKTLKAINIGALKEWAGQSKIDL